MNPKVALVTGGSRGIGKAIVLALAARGWQVAFSFLSNLATAQQTLAEVEAAGGRSLMQQADLAVAGDRQKLLDRVISTFGCLHLLVNNAGMAPRQRSDLLEMSEASYDEVMAANLKGPFFLTQQAARIMLSLQKREPGSDPTVINIGSISATTSSTNRGEYCISKAGMGMMTALFADRLAGEGIRVYEVRPGIIATDMTARVQAKYDQAIASGLLPLARWGQPEDVARAVVALAEGALPYSTGEVIHVDGGFHLRRL
jgi:3-oxoacyl-[acyl-carrier protein] reductase